MLSEASYFYDFAKGFTRGRQLFDYVDVSGGHEATVEKIAGTFVSLLDIGFDNLPPQNVKPNRSLLLCYKSFCDGFWILTSRAEAFKLHLFDYHCRQIFFGGSHDRLYMPLLNLYARDNSALGRVTLLQGMPFIDEMLAMPYPKRALNNLFRTSNLNIEEDGTSSTLG